MNYKRLVAFLVVSFVVFNSSYAFMSWSYNQPSLDDFYELRLFFDVGTPPPDWYLTVNLYQEDGQLIETKTSYWYGDASCFAVSFLYWFSVTGESRSIQDKMFEAFEYGNESRPEFSFVVESDTWQLGNSSMWSQWYQEIESTPYPVVVGLGPQYPVSILTHGQLETLTIINLYCGLMITWFFIGYMYRKELEVSK